MSITAEEVRARIAAATGGGLTADKVRAVLAAGGAPGEAAPAPVVERPTLEQVGASFSKPILETAKGIQELNLEGNPLREGLERRMEGTQEALDWAEQNQAPGTSGMMAGVAGEIAQMAVPASKAYRLTKAMTKGRPILQKVAPITAESATMGGMEGLKTPEEGETRAGNIGDAFVANLAGAAGQKLLSKIINPQMFKRSEAAKEEMEALAAAGITPDIPITLGTQGTGVVSKPAVWALRGPAMGLPGTKSKLGGQIDKATGDWRELMARKAVPEGASVQTPPYRKGEAPMETLARAIKNFYKNEYKEVLDPYSFDVMGQGPVGNQISAAISAIPGGAAQRQVLDKVGDLLQAQVDSGGRLTGSGVSTLKGALRREAKLAQDGSVQQGYQDVLNALETGVEKGIRAVNPAHADRYISLREPYRYFIALDDAVGRAPRGEFQPKGLRKSGERQARKSGTNLRNAAYRAEADRAAEIYDIPPNVRDSNVFQLRALGNVLLGGGAATGASLSHPIGALYTGAVAGTAGLGIPRWGQKYMMSEYPHQKAIADLLRKPLSQEVSRAMRIGGGQYGAE